MSIVSNIHSLIPFVAGETKAMHGQRLAKIGYKTTKKQAAKFKNAAVSVPVITNEQIIPFSEALIPYVRGLLENAQDGIIKSLYESANGAMIQVSDSEIDIPAIIAYLEAESTGGRLTKAALEDWFDSSLSENLTVLIADKLKYGDELTPEQETTVNQHVKGYKDIVSSLAGGKTFLQMKQINGLRVAFETINSDDEIVQKLTARLDNMEKEHNKNQELIDLL